MKTTENTKNVQHHNLTYIEL